MRVKKPKSKRTTTRMREGIKKKAAAKRRKDRKFAKKDPTWKSNKKKDIGIPASFPYKDRILQEIEAAKIRKEEELERKRSERIRQREIMADQGEEIDEGEVEEGIKQDSMAALMESAQRAATDFEGEDDGKMDEDDEEDEEFEVVDYEIEDEEEGESGQSEKSRKQFDKVFKNVVDASDVVLYVLDARDPERTRSRRVEEAVLSDPEKRLILILNKVDLVPETVLKQWIRHLQKSFPTVAVKASSGASNGKTFNKKLTQAATAGQLLQSLKLYAEKSNLKRAITVGVIGFPNVGKSSVINSLTTRRGKAGKACPVGNEAGVTRTLREVKVDNKLKILDSPGIVFPEMKVSGQGRKYIAELALLNAVPMKEVTDPELAVKLLIRRLAKDSEMADSFKQYYGLPELPTGKLDEFVKQVLIHIARSHGRLGKNGIPNLISAAMVILSDWRDGKFHGWAVPEEKEEEMRKEIGGIEQKTLVSEWSKEFDLDGLLNE
ncbi:DEKNAAC104140 [Brettanomyces naardenensis]|uniref:DEKNAAC104140 n=1 Tax=Brettanomyces naardenensis TaxID=13370 RepID=A0A448YQ23_BRENA|nr:DEKNAAC104140 [Brettanomyces naardenensis]